MSDTYAINSTPPPGSNQGISYPGYPVRALSPTKRVLVQENYDSATPPTADLQRFSAVAGSTATLVPKGTPAVWSRATHWSVGEIVGYILTVSGSITVQQTESDEV